MLLLHGKNMNMFKAVFPCRQIEIKHRIKVSFACEMKIFTKCLLARIYKRTSEMKRTQSTLKTLTFYFIICCKRRHERYFILRKEKAQNSTLYAKPDKDQAETISHQEHLFHEAAIDQPIACDVIVLLVCRLTDRKLRLRAW